MPGRDNNQLPDTCPVADSHKVDSYMGNKHTDMDKRIADTLARWLERRSPPALKMPGRTSALSNPFFS